MKIHKNTIELDGNEVATAIAAYLVAHDIHVSGPRTIRTAAPEPGLATGGARIYVDKTGRVLVHGELSWGTADHLKPGQRVLVTGGEHKGRIGHIWDGGVHFGHFEMIDASPGTMVVVLTGGWGTTPFVAAIEGPDLEAV